MLCVGTAGWSIPKQDFALAPGEGSQLQRYSRVFPCLEMNTTFYRSHRLATWQRWVASTPDSFRFSIKFPKAFTHIAKLVIAPHMLDSFCHEVGALGDKLGPILVQLPPSLHFADCPAAEFFEALRDRIVSPVALEPRHPSWFTQDAEGLLHRHRIARVAAHPSRDPAADPEAVPVPGGWPGLAYFRLHGAPRTYYSSYDQPYLAALHMAIKALPPGTESWVIFDNTALGHAFRNAFDLQRGERSRQRGDEPNTR